MSPVPRPPHVRYPGRFAGKAAVVTGGVSGIGEQIVRRLLDEGASVVAMDINAEVVAGAAERYRGHSGGGRVVGFAGDATKEDSFQGAIDLAVGEFGTLDVVFNVAGGQRPAPLLDMSYEDWEFTVRLNLFSAFLGTRLAGRRFRAEDKPGAVVNIASLNSFVPMHFGAGYVASKAGVVMLTKQAALELGEYDIRVNAVSPGLVATPLTEAFTSNGPLYHSFMDRIPAKRPADPAEIAAAATFLASDDASYINGDNLVVDGAWAQTGYPDLRGFM